MKTLLKKKSTWKLTTKHTNDSCSIMIDWSNLHFIVYRNTLRERERGI